MLLKLKKNLDPLKDRACAEIDAIAEEIRGHYITLGSGQAMVYAQKEKEAEKVTANPGVAPAEVPHIAQEAAAYGMSLLDQAAIVLTMAKNWRDLSSGIETIRLTSKDMVRAATTPAAIDQALSEAKSLLAGFVSFGVG
jgi:hypothetical protein